MRQSTYHTLPAAFITCHQCSCCYVLVSGLAGELTEQLRLLLEPTKASKLAGDFRTGKRISMRKVIAYIASHFRKDKIWLRRTRPDKRTYQVKIPSAFQDDASGLLQDSSSACLAEKSWHGSSWDS